MVGTCRRPSQGAGRFANRTADDVGDGRSEHAIIDVINVKVVNLEPMAGHPVAKNPQVGVLVHLDIARELESLRVLSQHGRGFGRQVVVLLRVPAADSVLVDERVENGAGCLVHCHGAGLHSSGAVAEMLVLIERVPAARVRLQNARVHREHPGAGHCLEVERPEAVPVAFGHAHAEQTVRPLDPDTSDVEYGGQWVEVEVMVLDSPGPVALVVVHHQAAAEVRQVGERTVA